MKNLNIVKSNKNSSFQRFIDGKVVLGVKAFSKYDIPYPENACLEELVALYNNNKIKLTTLIYISKKNKLFLKNKNLNNSIQLLTEWSIESGYYNSQEYHFKI
jgi:hypothetical protein